MKKCSMAALLLLSACSHSTTTPVASDKCDFATDYQVAFTRLDETLQQIAHGSGCFIEADLKQVGALTPNPVTGHMSAVQAVKMAVAGTGLTAQHSKLNTIQVTQP
ncbi:hypothetical protein JYB87_07160 [Shewanella avicenniae]|uniref:Lipoprotein n=1 Tax=Shewanella avicenniae TaxID=2814294 RepID=A0ABX7QU76_9GAMM|nr:hypothetical protein [Shewanella avicenniae]QSX34989.1 hypothetical protein JYB87_07160 [Shewanella avicenniae]